MDKKSDKMSLGEQIDMAIYTHTGFYNEFLTQFILTMIVGPLIEAEKAENERLSLAFIKVNHDAVEQIDELKRQLREANAMRSRAEFNLIHYQCGSCPNERHGWRLKEWIASERDTTSKAESTNLPRR